MIEIRKNIDKSIETDGTKTEYYRISLYARGGEFGISLDYTSQEELNKDFKTLTEIITPEKAKDDVNISEWKSTTTKTD